MLKITIPEPCHENWDKMTHHQQGRHCAVCEKTVVDFTQMTDDEVRYFLINKKQERLCGRFSSNQLHHINIELPQNIFQLQLPLWKQFLVASLLVFSTTLFSCDVNIKAEVVRLNNPTLAIAKTHPMDTVPGKRTIVGQLMARPVQCTTITKGEVKVNTLMSDTAIVEEPKPEGTFLGEISVAPVKDTLVTKSAEPFIMGKMIAVPKKPNEK